MRVPRASIASPSTLVTTTHQRYRSATAQGRSPEVARTRGVEGPRFLNVRIQSAGHDDRYSGEARIVGDAAAASSLMFTCEYEGYVYATISVSIELPFALDVGDTPGEVVVDLATGG